MKEKLFLNLVNGARTGQELAPLQANARLNYLARLKSRDMLRHDYFAHRSPVYGSAGEMLRKAGVKFSLGAENIGAGGSIRAIFSAFMESSGHRNKIMDPRYSLTGIGILYKRGRGYLVTQLFVRPKK
ncbi:MAG: hypothetical protein GX044_04310 [Firmicutes bacterium]|jgi:uncharacterized protein YkwD|nr:hypothetical protein [Bacillota bacterium]